MLNNDLNRGNVLLLSQHDNKIGHASIVQAMKGSKGKRVGYIASEPDTNRIFYNACKTVYEKLGFEMNVYLELEDEYNEQSVEALFNCDAVHLSGGDTFRFLKGLQTRGLLHRISEFNLSGGIVIGVSAGAMIITPSIESAFLCGDKNTVNLTDFTGLHLVNLRFIPHVNKLIIDGALPNTWDCDVFFCSDYDGILIKNEQLQYIGEPIKINAESQGKFLLRELAI
ncbi:peptidase S51 [Parashewanella spongiae]|uniref:Peptidase S51 n=1 Tax=Parashewanella spongiae TaxID=342950 RepID=A0A3A6TZK4_9GAMM|nr:Type 1 glutamine amidotransferase-like domain-containing protein [Parashewanella spongiae]MCL1080095.1 Type 1 glutamine amidotransferase-like domain-containing protein [Parashewanella spongiae]RJY07076.1 peptidase S51 [Parashewanella spongiae]